MVASLLEAVRLRTRITVHQGAELNYGPSEDSDSEIRPEPVEVQVIGPAEGALRVRIIGPDGKPGQNILYYHQPAPKPQQG